MMSGIAVLLCFAVLHSALHETAATLYLKHVAQDCKIKEFSQNIDHFNWGTPGNGSTAMKFNQRYFYCDQYWDADSGPVWFYFGNEAEVTLYVNHTGLMWENAPKYQALLIFAEHRYYGTSLPFEDGSSKDCMNWLTTEQAIADFATLIKDMKQSLNLADRPWIGFGGSYGGMLAAWFRVRHPELIDGVIAASAPIWSYLGMDPPYDPSSYNIGVTYAVTPAAGAKPDCLQNIKAAQPKIHSLAATADGRKLLEEAFLTCHPLKSQEDAEGLLSWFKAPWAYLAMGNYPYPSNYITPDNTDLPAWPVRAACDEIGAPGLDDDLKLMTAIRKGMAVWYNRTGDLKCFFDSSPFQYHRMNPYAATSPKNNKCEGNWGYQWCTEMTQPFSSGIKDMFWPEQPFNLTASSDSCQLQWGVRPRPYWAPLNLASKDLTHASNIVFSNGKLDPWHLGGVLQNISDSVIAVVISDGAHHLDLMFSNPSDPQDVLDARQTELRNIEKWMAEKTK